MLVLVAGRNAGKLADFYMQRIVSCVCVFWAWDMGMDNCDEYFRDKQLLLLLLLLFGVLFGSQSYSQQWNFELRV